MVKTERPWTGGNILAAVDVGNADGEHRTLHAGIVSHGYDIAGLAKGTLHVVTAHPTPMLSAADPPFSSRKPSKRATASNAAASRANTTSVTSACMCSKARPMW